MLYVVLATVNGVLNYNASSSEVDPSSSSSEPTSSSSSEIDIYKNEKAINVNLLSIVQDYDDVVTSVVGVGYDEDYLYIVGIEETSDIHIYKGELGSYTVNELLELLITSKDVFEVTNNINNYRLTNGVSPDITSLDSFSYKEYTYKDKYLYYYDEPTNEIVGLTSIGYKANSYISIIDITYNTSTSIYDEACKNVVSDVSTEYYKLLDYYYHI